MPTGRLDHAESAWHTSLQEFGEQLRYKREHVLRLTQAEMAARVGIHQSRISRIEAGGKPKDKSTTVVMAREYQLSAAETKAWLELLYGSTTVFQLGDVAGGRRSGIEVGQAYELLEQIHSEYEASHAYDYFQAGPSSAFLSLDGAFDRAVLTAINWLLIDTRRLPRAHLLVEFAATLMHHLNHCGQARLRLALALDGAEAAQELERRTIEGWLRCDAIPWTLMERTHDASAARWHLERGLMLARQLNNREMEALGLALLARTHLLSGDNRRARANLTRARRLNPSPAVQTRVNWIDGELAMRQKHYDEAFTLYRAAEASDVGLGGGHHTVITPLLRLAELYMKLLDLKAAREVYLTLLNDMRPPLVGHRLARTLFGLARVTRLEEDIDQARLLIDDALTALAASDDDPPFRHIMTLFVASLPD